MDGVPLINSRVPLRVLKRSAARRSSPLMALVLNKSCNEAGMNASGLALRGLWTVPISSLSLFDRPTHVCKKTPRSCNSPKARGALELVRGTLVLKIFRVDWQPFRIGKYEQGRALYYIEQVKRTSKRGQRRKSPYLS